MELAAGADAPVARGPRDRIRLRVLASSAAATELLARALPAFEARYARVQVQLRGADGEDPVPLMERAEVDLVAGRRPAALPEGWWFEDLLAESFAPVCAARHPLARKVRVSWRELAQHPWLLPPAGTPARIRFDASMEQARAAPAAYCVVPNPDDMTDWLVHDREVLAFTQVAALTDVLAGGELVRLQVDEPGRESCGLLQPCCMAPAALRLAGFLHHFATAACDAHATRFRFGSRRAVRP